MAKDDDDDRPKKKIVHEIGQDLALLSVKELQERIALLNERSDATSFLEVLKLSHAASIHHCLSFRSAL